jgi:uncharacterized membrane protein YphA (DoxX/SURF4 family)
LRQGSRTHSSARVDLSLLALRLLSGGVFVAFGLGKFVNHASELASFKLYGLPAPGAFVIVIGALELVGGGLLMAGWQVRPAALVLTGDMALHARQPPRTVTRARFVTATEFVRLTRR